ncbi:hypothetical protein BV898_16613 [Hypsibius exemplaris]|uniref:Cilia- and flagella-associated protein 61 N-terminal domain-containing protein n=1 Tax=Hypsibius exemplaris TaxID=2072580 RepID=A0A9X6NFN3_HYPEX|nr:hypothetical protein BV898_16613 [Hypsibius exemplaris]
MEPNSTGRSLQNGASLEGERKKRNYFKARRAEYSDIAALQILAAEECNKETLGRQVISQLIEDSLISVTVIEQTKRFEHITGYASFNDTPTRVLPGLKNWSDVLQRSLPHSYFSTANSVFLTSLITEPRNSEEVLEECLKVLFTVNPELDYCLLLSGVGAFDSPFEKYFTAWMDLVGEDVIVHLAICKKENVYPEIVIRPAEILDVPKVLPYFGKLHERLHENLGENWLERIVRTASSSKDTKCCVVEDSRGQICGFFSVTSSNIDWEYLDTHYQTNIFHQFLRITDFDRLAGRLSNCDVELGTGETDEDLVFGPRDSVPSTTELENLDNNNKRKVKAKGRHHKRPKESEEELKFTTSVERYISDLIRDLCNITVSETDPEVPEADKQSEEVIAASTTAFASVLPEVTVENPVETDGTVELHYGDVFTNIPIHTYLPDAEKPIESFVTFKNFPVGVVSESTNKAMKVESHASQMKMATSTASLLSSAESIVNILLNEVLQIHLSSPILEERSVNSVGSSVQASLDPRDTDQGVAESRVRMPVDPRGVNTGALEARRNVVADYSKTLDVVLSRLYRTMQERSSQGLTDGRVGAMNADTEGSPLQDLDRRSCGSDER